MKDQPDPESECSGSCRQSEHSPSSCLFLSLWGRISRCLSGGAWGVCEEVFGFLLFCCVTSWISERWNLSSSVQMKNRCSRSLEQQREALWPLTSLLWPPVINLLKHTAALTEVQDSDWFWTTAETCRNVSIWALILTIQFWMVSNSQQRNETRSDSDTFTSAPTRPLFYFSLRSDCWSLLCSSIMTAWETRPT